MHPLLAVACVRCTAQAREGLGDLGRRGTRRGGLLRMREPAGAPPAGAGAVRSISLRQVAGAPSPPWRPGSCHNLSPLQSRSGAVGRGRGPRERAALPPLPLQCRGSVSAARTRRARTLARSQGSPLRDRFLARVAPIPSQPALGPLRPCTAPPCLRPRAPAQQVLLPAEPGRPDSGFSSARASGRVPSPQTGH